MSTNQTPQGQMAAADEGTSGAGGAVFAGITASAQAPESYFWPLVALILVILPQVLVPARMREGPPLIVPIIEGVVVLVLLAVAAKPGPVPRTARPLILSLFAVLVLSNTTAATRLVVVVLRTPPKARPQPP